MTYTFENVVAWQKAHAFVLLVYRITKSFPSDELYGLTSQFRRAAVSIEANIAEGCSMEECRDYILLARDLYYISDTDFSDLHDALEDASKMLYLYCNGIINNNGIKD